MNSKIYNGNVQPNPKEFKIWVDDEGTIKTWNGTEWIEAASGGDSGSGSGNSEDFLYIRISSFGYGFYTDIDVLNNKIMYYKQLDGVVTTYETPDEFLDAHGTNTLATIPDIINWDDKYAIIYLVNLNY